jgi:ParB/RepB/Spo0J family partition protein
MANENSKTQAQTIPLAKIHDLPGVFISKQPDKAYGGLVTSIQAGGVKEPVILRLREDGEYQLVTGYRRLRASELAKKQDIPALVYDMTPQEAIDYHNRVQKQLGLPIPGKLVKSPVLDGKSKKSDIKGAENPTTGTQKMDKPTEAPAPVAPTKDGKAQEGPAPKAREKPAAPVAGDKPKETLATAAPTKDGKTQETPGPKPGEKPIAPVVFGPVAKGPAGTAISQVFDERLSPPDEKALKDLPVPKEGESFFITLHPAYLEKSKYNVFSVDQSSENFRELKKSVELVGIKDPVLARLKPEGGLEILSGQRRHLAALALNYPVPTIIQKIDDADAKIIVADGNLHRDKISMYDLSRALRMKMEGMKQKSGRREKGTFKAEELDSDEKLALEMGMSVSKLNRMIRLSEATKNVCARVDDGSLHLSTESAISFLKPESQDEVLRLMDLGYKVKNEQVERMKKVDKAGKLDEMTMRDILDDKDLKPKLPPMPPSPAPHQTVQVVDGQTTTLQGGQIIPPSPDVKPSPEQMAGTQPTPDTAIPAAPGTEPPAPTAETTVQAAPATSPAPVSGNSQEEKEPFKGGQERPEITKVILTGDRLRKYFPDVSMTPREIEESVYDALEERRQRQIKSQQKDAIFQRGKTPGR